jgi:hypothetical protein
MLVVVEVVMDQVLMVEVVLAVLVVAVMVQVLHDLLQMELQTQVAVVEQEDLVEMVLVVVE